MIGDDDQIDLAPAVGHGEVDQQSGRDIAARQLHAHSIALLERVGAGRPSLAQDAGISGESPKRQVRLPQPLSNKLDELAQRQHRKPSELMREAAEEYIQKHSA